MGKENGTPTRIGFARLRAPKKITKFFRDVGAVELLDVWELYDENMQRAAEGLPQSAFLNSYSEYVLSVRGKRLIELTEGEIKNWRQYPDVFIRVYQGYGMEIVLEPDRNFTNFRSYVEISPTERLPPDMRKMKFTSFEIREGSPYETVGSIQSNCLEDNYRMNG